VIQEKVTMPAATADPLLGESHLRRIHEGAQAIVGRALAGAASLRAVAP
jgi:hypothetical protein